MSHIFARCASQKSYCQCRSFFDSQPGNSGFFHDLIFEEVSELDGTVWFIIGSVCKQFDSS